MTPPIIVEILRCKSLASKDGKATRALDSGTALQLRTEKIDGGWMETWSFRGPAAGDDLDVFLDRVNWQNRQPGIRFLEDGTAILDWTRYKIAPKVDTYDYRPPPVEMPPPSAHPPPTGPEFDPNDFGPTFDEDDYAAYRDDD